MADKGMAFFVQAGYVGMFLPQMGLALPLPAAFDNFENDEDPLFYINYMLLHYPASWL